MMRGHGGTALAVAMAWLATLGAQALPEASAAEAPTSAHPGPAGPAGDLAAADAPAIAVPAPRDRSGRDIFRRFREGLGEPACSDGVDPRWRRHFAHVPGQLEGGGGDLLALFGYVVDALREANLPTEFALIPFVESGYRPAARSAAGPAGLWQFMARTARDHSIPVSATYDGRLSPVASTRAAVRYLKTLHGMFAGDWRLAVMAFNAGEYRVLSALKRHGQRAADARPVALSSLTGITQAYVGKLHALSCLLAEAEGDARWMRTLDRPVPRLVAVELPVGTVDLG
ncbi:MAG TPA: lytic transglycosylase domain-containing protein, partial [Luteimonas sp.]|nr:lytic transglycosylase domain-containing protein [Luteimonas sp.]